MPSLGCRADVDAADGTTIADGPPLMLQRLEDMLEALRKPQLRSGTARKRVGGRMQSSQGPISTLPITTSCTAIPAGLGYSCMPMLCARRQVVWITVEDRYLMVPGSRQ